MILQLVYTEIGLTSPALAFKIANVNQGGTGCQFFSLSVDPNGGRTTDLSHSKRTLYPVDTEMFINPCKQEYIYIKLI